MRVTNPDHPSPSSERTPTAPNAPAQATSPVPPWRVASIAALVVVLVIGAFVTTFLALNRSHPAAHLTRTGPINPSVEPSVYLVAGNALYAIAASDGTRRWQTHTDGSVTPDPIVANGVVYTTAIPNSLVTARRASDGVALWSKLVIQAEGKRIALAGDTLYMTTDMFGGDLLAPGFVHGVYALRASDGAIRWHHDTTDPVISPPLVVDGVVYAGVGASLVALRASDGVQLWQRPLAVGGHPYLPLWLAFSSGTIYTYGREQNPDQPYTPGTGFGDATVFAVQASDGSARWSRRLDGGEPDQEASTPVIADGVVYVRSNGLGTQALARGVPGFGLGLHALRASDGAPLWTYPAAVTQSAVAGGVVYVGDLSGSSASNVVALRGTDGTLLWKQQVAGSPRDDWRMSPPAVANGMLYVASGLASITGGDVAVKSLRVSDGRLRWQCRLPGASAIQLGTPAFAA